jgi:hypothetical protein
MSGYAGEDQGDERVRFGSHKVSPGLGTFDQHRNRHFFREVITLAEIHQRGGARPTVPLGGLCISTS